MPCLAAGTLTPTPLYALVMTCLWYAMSCRRDIDADAAIAAAKENGHQATPRLALTVLLATISTQP